MKKHVHQSPASIEGAKQLGVKSNGILYMSAADDHHCLFRLLVLVLVLLMVLSVVLLFSFFLSFCQITGELPDLCYYIR